MGAEQIGDETAARAQPQAEAFFAWSLHELPPGLHADVALDLLASAARGCDCSSPAVVEVQVDQVVVRGVDLGELLRSLREERGRALDQWSSAILREEHATALIRSLGKNRWPLSSAAAADPQGA